MLTKTTTTTKIPSLPIQRAAPFTLGHTASHAVCPQRGKRSRVGCSRPYLPAQASCICQGALPSAVKQFLMHSYGEQSTEPGLFPLAAQHSSGKGLMLLSQNTDRHVSAQLLCIFPSQFASLFSPTAYYCS